MQCVLLTYIETIQEMYSRRGVYAVIMLDFKYHFTNIIMVPDGISNKFEIYWNAFDNLKCPKNNIAFFYILINQLSKELG